jgi:hypothetical protein
MTPPAAETASPAPALVTRRVIQPPELWWLCWALVEPQVSMLRTVPLLAHSRYRGPRRAMSAFRSKADIPDRLADVR